MLIQTQYSFSVPRTDDGGADFNTIARDLLDSGADVNIFMGVMTEVARLVAVGRAKPDLELTLAVGLKYGTPGIIGNPSACAQLVDSYFNIQWSKARSESMSEAGEAVFNGILQRWRPATERVTIQPKPTLPV